MIHGQKRSKKEKTAQQLKEEEQKSQKINSKLKQFFQIRKKEIQDHQIPALLQFTSLLMQLCSDIPTVFNFRREVLTKLLDNNKENLAERAKILSQDYKLNTKIIQLDPKSYTLWTHRQWVILKLFELDQSILEKEKQLIRKLLQKDQKNFHVWNYRSWVNSIKTNIESELAFTKQKITENPFNFSPLHFRSKYLQAKFRQYIRNNSQLKRQIMVCGLSKSQFDEQIQSIQTAMFLNPKQQGPWNYFNWIIQRIVPAILIKKIKIDEKTSQLIFNMKISNPKILVRSGNHQTMKVSSLGLGFLSDRWVVQSQSDYQMISSDQYKLDEGQQPIQLQNNGFFIIGSNKKKNQLSLIHQTLTEQLKFVDQVIESEEGQVCRFGLLQKIYIYKALLMIGSFDQKNMQKMCGLVKETFDRLKDETKTQKYIGKLKQYWGKVQRGQDQLAILMKDYCNRKIF